MSRPPHLRQSLPGLWRVFRYFWPLIRQERRLIVVSIAALVAGIGLRLLEPWPLKFVFDRVLKLGRRSGASGWTVLDALDGSTLLAVCALAVVLFTALRALADYGHAVGFATIGNRVLNRVRTRLYGHLQGLSLSFHSQAKAGDLVVRVVGDVNLLKDVTSTAILPLVANLGVLVGMLIVMLLMEWRLTLVALATAPLFLLTTVRINRRIRESARRRRRREGAMAAAAAEAITSIKSVQALSLERVFAEAFAQSSGQVQHEDQKASRLSARLNRSVDVLLAGATALVLWYGARLVLEGALSPGDLLVFLAYLKRAFNPVQDFAKYTARLAKATAAGERVLEIFERTPEITDSPTAIAAGPLRGAVRFDNVRFDYGDGVPVLAEVDLDIAAGQHVAIVGPSGIGKSTLVSLLLRLYDPTEGRVLVDGCDIRDYTVASLRAQIGVVLQESTTFAGTVAQNIGCGLPRVTPEQIAAAARLANIHDFIARLPDGYDTVLAERGVTLSHGQRQRIAIARAAVRQTPLLILDEPTSGLDEENERSVLEALERLCRGRTTFVITHNLAQAARADWIVYLDRGRVLECGSHAQLMQAGGRYAALYRLQCSEIGAGDLEVQRASAN